jgi:hypothetical protein
MTALFSPSERGRAAEGGRGSLTHHLELEGQHIPSPAAEEHICLSPNPDQRPVERHQKHQDRRLYCRKNDPDFQEIFCIEETV